MQRARYPAAHRGGRCAWGTREGGAFVAPAKKGDRSLQHAGVNPWRPCATRDEDRSGWESISDESYMLSGARCKLRNGRKCLATAGGVREGLAGRAMSPV